MDSAKPFRRRYCLLGPSKVCIRSSSSQERYGGWEWSVVAYSGLHVSMIALFLTFLSWPEVLNSRPLHCSNSLVGSSQKKVANANFSETCEALGVIFDLSASDRYVCKVSNTASTLGRFLVKYSACGKQGSLCKRKLRSCVEGCNLRNHKSMDALARGA
jgi:hypothetical protein